MKEWQVEASFRCWTRGGYKGVGKRKVIFAERRRGYRIEIK